MNGMATIVSVTLNVSVIETMVTIMAVSMQAVKLVTM